MVADICRTKDLPGKLKHESLPDLGITDDVRNLVITFDKYWCQEPKNDPNIFKVVFKTLWKD